MDGGREGGREGGRYREAGESRGRGRGTAGRHLGALARNELLEDGHIRLVLDVILCSLR